MSELKEELRHMLDRMPYTSVGDPDYIEQNGYPVAVADPITRPDSRARAAPLTAGAGVDPA